MRALLSLQHLKSASSPRTHSPFLTVRPSRCASWWVCGVFVAQCAAVLIAFWVYHSWVASLIDSGELRLGAVSAKMAPLYAYWKPRFKTGLILAVLILAGYGFSLRRMLRNESIGGSRFVAALMFWMAAISIAVAGIDGSLSRLARPFEKMDLDYYGAITHVHELREFIGGYVVNMLQMPMHAQNHPPGAVRFLWFVTRLIGESPLAAACATIAFSTLSIPAVYLLAADVLGRLGARIAAGLFVLMPNVLLFTATSMDGPFTVLLTWSMYLGWTALRRGELSRGFAAGVVLALALFMTFSGVIVGLLLVLTGVAVFRYRADSSLAGSWRLAGMIMLMMALGGMAVLATGYHPADMLGAAMLRSSQIMGEGGHVNFTQYGHIALANVIVFLFSCGIALAILWLLRADGNDCRLRTLSNAFLGVL